GNYGKLRIRNLEDLPFITEYLGKIIIFWENFSKIIMSIKDLLTGVNSSLLIDYEKHMDNIDGIQQRISEFYNGMISMYNPDLKEYAYWLESFKTADENYPNGILNYAPLNINQILNDKLYANVKSIVFTSATLAIRGIFKYYSNRMGLDLLEKGYVQELVVDSPFDYKKQTMILVAGFLPEPKDRFFPAQSIELIKKAIEVSQAGTMVLFTSYKDLNNGYEEVSEDFYSKNILLLAQDKGMGRTAILNEFRENKKAVLLGTNSFWEGVDIPGESLELLVLYKLPFLAPTEPIVEAYLEKLQAEGKDSFMFYMLPNALLKYRQGFGRLIRNKTDKGVVLVLDNRILTKRYGHYFKDIVPANTIITSSVVEILDHLGRWFKGF
ncbi:MAG: DNA polymerase III subunit epsilon, partial [Candidatus Cloacimonetes bacterium]|nr:DNA polymerase III subunit epsilon [Candidatus Cloacimonadota bacterium]